MLILRAKISTQEDLFSLIKANAEAIREAKVDCVTVSMANRYFIDHLNSHEGAWRNFFRAFDRTSHAHVGWIMFMTTYNFIEIEEPLVILRLQADGFTLKEVQEQLFREALEETLNANT